MKSKQTNLGEPLKIIKERGQTVVRTHLKDQLGGDMKRECAIIISNGQISIAVQGYGEMAISEGFGTPIGIEIANEQLRVLAWNDINREEPFVINMEKAREDAYIPLPS